MRTQPFKDIRRGSDEEYQKHLKKAREDKTMSAKEIFDTLIPEDKRLLRKMLKEPAYEVKYAIWPNGKLMYMHEFLDGEPHGICRNWYRDGQKKSVANWQHGKLHGRYQFWYEKGTIYFDSHYKYGILIK